MFSKVKSLHGETGGSIFTNGQGYDKFYPCKTKGDHPDALMRFIHDVGVPQTLVTDGAKELTDGQAGATCQEYRIDQKVTVPYSPWQNLAEASIRELKRGVRRVIRRTGAHIRTWSYAAKWVTDIRRLTALDLPQLEGQVPEAHISGCTPDISPMALFDYWQVIYYHTPVADFPFQKKTIGRWLGTARDCTDKMSFIIVG